MTGNLAIVQVWLIEKTGPNDTSNISGKPKPEGHFMAMARPEARRDITMNLRKFGRLFKQHVHRVRVSRRLHNKNRSLEGHRQAN
jgi:hypothetical protein